MKKIKTLLKTERTKMMFFKKKYISSKDVITQFDDVIIEDNIIMKKIIQFRLDLQHSESWELLFNND